jgi:hypothetical protein
MSYATAYANFAMIAAEIPSDDEIMLREEWNNYTDMLCKEGDMTDLQYHHCPAYDENCDMNDEETLDFILESMGFTFSHGPLRSKRSDDNMSDMPRHFLCCISRNSRSHEFWFSQGAGHTESPTLTDTLSCLIMDASNADESFESWCEEYGYDDDSRKAERIYNAVKETRAALFTLMSKSEMDDLQEHFSECGL